MNNETLAALIGGAALFIFLVVVFLRSRRVSRWAEILDMPATAVSELRGRSKLQLPRGVELDSDEPLFDVLYDAYKDKPVSFAPAALTEALNTTQPKPQKAQSGLSHAVAAVAGEKQQTDDQQITDLVSAQSYGQSNYVPINVVAISLLKNLMGVLRGKKKLRDGMKSTVAESLGAGGGLAGAKLGNLLGLSLVPLVTNPVLLPASMIFGAWLGSYAGRRLGHRIKARQLYAAMKKLKQTATEFKRSFLVKFPKLMEQLDESYVESLRYTDQLLARRQNRVSRVFLPSFMSYFYVRASQQLHEDWASDRREWKLIRKRVKAMPPQELAYLLYCVGAASFREDPELLEQFRAYEEALHEMKLAQTPEAA